MTDLKSSVSDLRTACETLLSYLQELGYEEIEIAHDFYWDVLPEESFDMDRKPTELAVGSIADDLEKVDRVISNSNDVYLPGVFALAAVLRALGVAVQGNPRASAEQPGDPH